MPRRGLSGLDDGFDEAMEATHGRKLVFCMSIAVG